MGWLKPAEDIKFGDEIVHIYPEDLHFARLYLANENTLEECFKISGHKARDEAKRKASAQRLLLKAPIKRYIELTRLTAQKAVVAKQIITKEEAVIKTMRTIERCEQTVQPITDRRGKQIYVEDNVTKDQIQEVISSVCGKLNVTLDGQFVDELINELLKVKVPAFAFDAKGVLSGINTVSNLLGFDEPKKTESKVDITEKIIMEMSEEQLAQRAEDIQKKLYLLKSNG